MANREPLKHLNIPESLGIGEGGATLPKLYDYFKQIDDYIDELKNQSGAGDMKKEVYDTDDSGKVDEAENVSWGNVSGKPSSYPPETHNHDESYAPINHNHEGTYAPVSHAHATGVTQIADPATVELADVAEKVNELIAALQG